MMPPVVAGNFPCMLQMILATSKDVASALTKNVDSVAGVGGSVNTSEDSARCSVEHVVDHYELPCAGVSGAN